MNLTIDITTDTNEAFIQVATGQYEIACGAMGPAMLNAVNRGADLKIIAAGAASPPGHGNNLPLVVRTQLIDSGEVKTVSDLRQRKIAIPVRGASECQLAKVLATGGLTASDVDVEIIPAPDMVAAMSTGAIDAGLLLQSTAAQADAKGVGKILFDD